MLYLVVVTLVLGDALAERGDVDVDARPLGDEVLVAVHLPLAGLLRDPLRDERPDTVLSAEHDLAHFGVAQDLVEDRLVLPVRHLEPDMRVSEVSCPGALEERKRVAIPILDPAQVERAVPKLERVERAVGVEQLVVTEDVWVRAEQSAKHVAPCPGRSEDHEQDRAQDQTGRPCSSTR